MRTRNAGNPKPAASPAKKTPPPKKAAAAAAAKTQTTPNSTEVLAESPASVTEVRRTPTTRGKLAKAAEAASIASPPAVEEGKSSAEVAPEAKPASGTKTTRRVVKKVVKKTVVRAVSKRTAKQSEAEKVQVEDEVGQKEVDDEAKVELMKEVGQKEVDDEAKVESMKEVGQKEVDDEAKVELMKEVSQKEVDDEAKVEPMKEDETVNQNVEQPAKPEEPIVENVEGSEKCDENVEEPAKPEGPVVENVEGSEKCDENVEEPAKPEQPIVENVEGSEECDQDMVNVDENTKKEEGAVVVVEPSTENVTELSDIQESIVTKVKSVEDQGSSEVEEDQLKEEKEESKHFQETKGAEELIEQKEHETVENKVEAHGGTVQMDEDVEEEIRKEDTYLEEAGEGNSEGYCDDVGKEQQNQGDFVEGDMQGNVEETDELEEERAELDAVAKERKLRKELEVFVGGLDRDATEEDVKKVFEYAGEVVEVRLHKDPSTNKNKGYAFVRFASKEQTSRALSEMKNPVIRGKRCGTAATEDNDTLFLGNICNTWTKEAIRQKLKDYGVEGVETITLVADPRHEGLSRGFAFVEFSSHGEAMCAYKRLQKPDAIFGHSERTAKVAFAEPLREPNPVVMSQVKSVFIDGLPPYWDDDRVREKFKDFGEIARIMLARNMSTAKRKDFGFVDFASHEAAVACVEGINNTELGDGNAKTKVRARLSNPLPKTQAVKGGMCGGFRVGRGTSGTFPKIGGGFGRGGPSSNRATFQRDRGFYQRGPGQGSRMDFPNDHELDYPPFHGRQNFGRGGRWGFRGAHQMAPGGPPLPSTNMDRPRHGAVDRGRGGHNSFQRQTFPYEDRYNRPFMGRNYDDPYLYNDTGRGGKRPHFMTDPDPDYMEPSRLRARLDYSDPAIPLRGNRYRDAYGADTGPYSQDYYGPDYRQGAYPSSHGASRPYPPSHGASGMYPPSHGTSGPYPSSHGASGPYPSAHGASGPYPSSHGANRPYGRGYYY